MTTLSEEMQMFLEVGKTVSEGRNFANSSSNFKRQAVGITTENVIRNHLTSKGLNISKPRVYLNPSWMEIDMLSLKPQVDPLKSKYSADEVKTVIEIKNNAVGDQTTLIKSNFNKLKQISNEFNFAVIVLSERDGYKYAIKQEALGYPVFTMLTRKVQAGRWMWSSSETLGVYNKIMTKGNWAGKPAMRETGQWQALLNHLKA